MGDEMIEDKDIYGERIEHRIEHRMDRNSIRKIRY